MIGFVEESKSGIIVKNESRNLFLGVLLVRELAVASLCENGDAYGVVAICGKRDAGRRTTTGRPFKSMTFLLFYNCYYGCDDGCAYGMIGCLMSTLLNTQNIFVF